MPTPRSSDDFRLRVFLSYGRKDYERTAKAIKKRLDELDVDVLWDGNIDAGEPFSEAIRELISSAHLFVTLITPHAKTGRGFIEKRDTPSRSTSRSFRSS